MNEVNNSVRLAGKCALITGAAVRVGAVIARRLHAEGASVAVHYRGSREAAENLIAELNAERAGSARVFQADLADLASIRKLIDDVASWNSRLDILVNNASSFYPTPIQEATEFQWDDLMASNLKAPYFLAQFALSYLRAAQGSIINIVDIHAQRPLRDHNIYGAAKAGLVMLTRSLAKDLAPEVRVNAVAPGAILWPDNNMSDETKETIIDQIPLGRSGSPADIAGAVIFFASEAEYVTGQVLAVDGGRSIGW